MAAAVTGWVTAALVLVGGGAVVAAAATPYDVGSRAPVAVGSAAGGAVGAAAGGAVGGAMGAATGVAPDAPGAAEEVRRPPLPGEPVRRFEAPPHDYGPGHRGVDLAAGSAAVVRSPADGVVTFVGPVAGRGVVVVEHAGGTLTSLEPVDGLLPEGTPVAVGQPVARVQPRPAHAGCSGEAGACLHWGVRVQGRYVDPWWWLGRAGPVRLLPVGP